MRRAVLSVLTIILLCSCAGESDDCEKRFSEWRGGVQNVSCTAQLTMSHGDMAADFELQCTYTPEECSVEILEPELIAGVRASRGPAGESIEFDGLILGIGDTDTLSPMSALPQLCDAIRLGHVLRCWEEEDGLTAVHLSEEDGVTLHLWLDENMTPVRADFEYGGEAVIKLAISDWRLE